MCVRKKWEVSEKLLLTGIVDSVERQMIKQSADGPIISVLKNIHIP